MSDQTLINNRILVIDDNPSIHKDFYKILNKSNEEASDIDRAEAELFGEEFEDVAPEVTFELDSAMQGQEGLDKIQNALEQHRPYAMAFVDMRMPPGWDGLKSIEEIWKIAADTQIVICTAYSDHTWIDICDRLGHSENLLILKKPFDEMEVSQTAIALTKKWALAKQARLKQQELESLVDERTAQLKHAASHDSLTGLPNRKEFHDRLHNELTNPKNKSKNTAVFLIDIDHFKNINDTFGHPAGDEVICGVAKRLQECVRQHDTVARLGGDEFAIIQPSVDNTEEIYNIGKRLKKAIAEPFMIDGHSICTGISVGVAVAPIDGTQSDQLLKNADLALYRAKGDGRGCLRFFETEMEEFMQARHQMETQIRHGLAKEEFVIHYQPLFDSKTNKVCGMEALVRWQNPVHGLMAPIQFINIAEETGLILPLGDWVISQACKDAKNWPADIRVAVNVSAVQIKSEQFIDSVVNAINHSGIDPDRLEIEITESILLAENGSIIDTLMALRELGVRVVMDDFGTGFSSLSYLQSFPFDKLKIDMSFVHNANEDKSSQAIVNTVANLGKCLDIETTAEGVETEQQLEKIIADGYSQFQGFLRGKPRPVAEITNEYFLELEARVRELQNALEDADISNK